MLFKYLDPSFTIITLAFATFYSNLRLSRIAVVSRQAGRGLGRSETQLSMTSYQYQLIFHIFDRAYMEASEPKSVNPNDIFMGLTHLCSESSI